MRIVLNAQLLSREQSFRSGGISRHIYHLLAELARDGRGHTYDVFAPDEPPADDPLRADWIRYHASGNATRKPTLRIAWEQSILPLRLRALRPDLLHSLAYATPAAWKGRSLVTIYDLSFLRFPEAFKKGNQLYLANAVRLSTRQAQRVITISEHAKSEIVALLDVPSERVDVTYLAADSHYRPLPADEVARFVRENDLPDRFIFYLGTLEPRKNLTGLLDAYALLPKPRAPLYVAGAAGWRYTPIFDRVTQLGLESDVRFLGFVAEEALPLWYNAARLFAYPSLYEGFGLPVLEAMACGTPVITSTAASLPEVGGRAATLVAPDDPTRLAAEMHRVLDDDTLHASMRAAGLIQATRFNWKTMADQTVRSYERAATGRS